MKRKRALLSAAAAGLVMLAGLLLLLGMEPATARAALPAAAGSAHPASPFATRQEAAAAAVSWLVETHQNDDGGYASFSLGANQAPSSVGGTLDALLALASTGTEVRGPLAWMEAHAAELAEYAGSSGANGGKALLALSAAGQDVTNFFGTNLVISLTDQVDAEGNYNAGNAFNQSLAIQGLAGAGQAVPPQAVAYLQSLQASGGELDGSWDDGFGTSGNADATAMAIMAQVAAGVPFTTTSLVSATDFLSRTQLSDGGFAYGAGFGSNANSTALVVQALSALGQDFYSPGGPWSVGGNTPLSALLSFQGESGAFQADFGFGPFDDFFATVQGLPGLTGKPYPLPAGWQAAGRALGCLANLQDQASGGWEQFAGFGVNAAGTSRAIEAIVAAGDDPASPTYTTISGTHPLDALAALAPDYLAGGRGGRVGVVMQGVAAAGGDVTSFAGMNLVISMTGFLSPTGQYDDVPFGIFPHAEAMLGLLAAGQPVDPSAVTFLLDQGPGGDWGGADNNGIALNVLGRLGRELTGTIDLLATSQLEEGGWNDFGPPASINASAEVVQGLVAASTHPFGPTWSKVVGGRLLNVADLVMAQQQADGCWVSSFSGQEDPSLVTDAVLLLTAKKPLWNLRLPLIASR